MKRNKALFNIIPLLLSLYQADILQGQLSGPAAIRPTVEVTPVEDMYLHIDRDKYIAGEDIWFSIYNIDRETGKLSSVSVVAYAELLNTRNVPIIQKRLQLSGGRGEGNFVVPDSVSSGTYTLRVYTNIMKNFLPDECFQQDIDIYNPFRGLEFYRKTNPVFSINDAGDFPEKNVGGIVLKSDTVFSRREKVHLDLAVKNYDSERSGISDMSISVAPAGISAIRPPAGNRKIADIKAPLKYFSESEGHYISGLIRYREGNISDSSDFLYMSVQGKVAEFRYSDIDAEGHFSFLLPVDARFRNLILQPEHASSNMILEIEPSFPRIFPASIYFKESLTDSLLDLFSGLSFNYQAGKIYSINRKNEKAKKDTSKLKKRRFYGIPEMEIFLDDYIKLPTMEEVFIEFLPGVILRSRKAGYEIKITNPLTDNFYYEPPLVMIDGVIINDLTVLVDLDPERVEKIEVVKTPYLIGDLILNGIVNVITRSGDFIDVAIPEYAVILPYKIIDEPSGIIFPDYSSELNRQSRTPDLRNTLYWNPSVQTDSDGKAEIEFWTSDLPGIYNIIIQGIAGTGEKISLFKSFTVR
jgi:hypothetical protein